MSYLVGNGGKNCLGSEDLELLNNIFLFNQQTYSPDRGLEGLC